MTEPKPLQQVDRTYVRFGRRKLSYFSGCDYFRLASHPTVLRAAREAIGKFGLNVAASRRTTGNHRLYVALEKRLADFFDAEDALLLSGGYVTSLVVAQALAGTFSHALVDERAHGASLDAAQLFDCPVLKFKHRDATDFIAAVKRCGRGARPVVLTDGMFPLDGSVAPLKAYLNSLPHDARVIVDDAHGAGVLGLTGKGSLEAAGVDRRRVIQCITLSKAFGAYGGAVLGTRDLRAKILERSRICIGSTPLPLPLAAAALAAAGILKADRRLRRRLFHNANRVRSALRQAGFDLPDAPGPIVVIHCPNARDLAGLKRRLLAAGIYPPFVKYPGGPPEGCFRFVISSEHSRAQLDGLISVLVKHPIRSNRQNSFQPSGRIFALGGS